MTCACSYSRAASFASNCAFSCCNRSYSAREMVTISSVLLVRISLFSMQILYQKAKQKARIFNGFQSLFLCLDCGQSRYRAVGFRLLDLQPFHEPAVLLRC